MDAADTLRAGDRRMHGMTSQVWISDQQMQATCQILLYKNNKGTIVMVHYIASNLQIYWRATESKFFNKSQGKDLTNVKLLL